MRTAILNQEIGTGSLGPLTLYGHTRDLSPSGLGIIVPPVDIGPPRSGEQLTARVRVELEGGGRGRPLGAALRDGARGRRVHRGDGHGRRRDTSAVARRAGE